MNEKIICVAKELKLSRMLAGNNKASRDKALKCLKKWFEHRADLPMDDDDFLRIWKGLFYSMWMSDKPLVQEECAEAISSILHRFHNMERAVQFFKCGLLTLMREWFGIDQLRLDKFLMFARRFLRQMLFRLKNNKWKKVDICLFCNAVRVTILNKSVSPPIGLWMHFAEIYLEELAKVSDGKLHQDSVHFFLEPFINHLAEVNDGRQIGHMRKHIFGYLMRQSDLGLEYAAKYEAWKQAGFPGSINCIQKIKLPSNGRLETEEEDGEANMDDKPLDPRAGRVDVELPQLKFSAKVLAKALSEIRFHPNSSTKTRKSIGKLTQQFQKLASGAYPLGVKQLSLPRPNDDTSVRKAVNRLVKFDKKLIGQQKDRVTARQVEDGEGELVDEEGELNEEPTQQRVKVKRKKGRSVEPDVIPVKRVREAEDDDSFEFSFRRNSGTWFVFKADSPPPTEPALDLAVPNHTSPEQRKKKKSKKRMSLPALHFSTPQRERKRDVFKTPERRFTMSSFPTSSQKKVKINTKLNRSQEVHEHHAQIISSPSIPFDPNKKPTKPLLKTTLAGPLNPFYCR